MRERNRSRWACRGGVAALLLLVGCEDQVGATRADASPADVAGDLNASADAPVDVRDDAPAPPLDARPPTPDAAPDVATPDAGLDRPAPGDVAAADAADEFGDVAEAVDDATAPEGAIVGTVSFNQGPGLPPSGVLSTMLASFARRTGGAAAEPTCTTAAMGPCSVKRCQISFADAGTAPPASIVGAGDVEVDGVPGGRVALPRLPTLGSYLANRFDAIFRGGETLRVRASGDPAGMPAFVATVPAPTPVALTAPTLPAGSIYLPVSVAQAMQLRWTGGGAEPVDVTVFGSSVPLIPPSTADRTQVTVECHFPAAPGAATIPLEVMSQLRGSMSGTLTVGTYQTRAYRVAPHVVTVFAGATAANWTTTFQ